MALSDFTDAGSLGVTTVRGAVGSPHPEAAPATAGNHIAEYLARLLPKPGKQRKIA